MPRRNASREHPSAAGFVKLARQTERKASPRSPPPVASTSEPDHLSLLPGSNPYDKAFLAGAISYAEAKVRDELHTRQEIAKLELEEKALALEARKQEIAVERGNLITKEDYLTRQEALVSTFLELLRLTATDLASRISAAARPIAIEEVTHKYQAALAALSKAVADKKPRDLASQAMHEAFRGE